MASGTALTAALTIVAAATAQTAAPAPPRASLVVGASIVAADTLDGIATCAEVAGNAPVRWQHDSVYVVGNTNVDAATGDRLRAEPHRLCFETRNGGLQWAVDNASSEVPHDCKAARRLLLRGRVVLPSREWGLVAIDRATGAIAWRRDDVPNDFVVPDGDLLVVAGSDRGVPKLAVLAAANGALACRVDLPDWPCRVCPGPHGIAVTLRNAVRVHDRTGPLLFEQPPAEVAAGVQGWFAYRPGREEVIECWSRTGDVRWRVATTRSRVMHEELTLFGTAAGDLLVFECRHSTAGGFRARCLALADGTELWACAVAGGARAANWMGIEARECGGAIVVTRPGIGASFAARLDPKDGAVLAQLDAASRR